MKEVTAQRVSQPLLDDVHWWFYNMVRKTGNRVIERFSLDDIATATGHGVAAVNRAIKDLVQGGVLKIERNRNGMYPRRYIYVGPVETTQEEQQKYIAQLLRRIDDLEKLLHKREQQIFYLERELDRMRNELTAKKAG